MSLILLNNISFSSFFYVFLEFTYVPQFPVNKISGTIENDHNLLVERLDNFLNSVHYTT